MPELPRKSRREFLLAATGAVAAGALHVRGAYAANDLTVDGVVELRQYTLHGGQRDVLISLFEREFIAPQNELGAMVRGTFRDLDDPDRFVWMRGFADMTVRRQALETFYQGPVWKRHKAAANATMLDSSNVLLLRPVLRDSAAGAAGRTSARSRGLYSAVIHSMHGTPAAAFRDFYSTSMRPQLAACGATPLQEFETEPTPNDYPRLPVRSDAVFVWLARWPGVRELDEFQRNWASLSGWRDSAPEAVLPALMSKPEVVRLAPTPTSAMR